MPRHVHHPVISKHETLSKFEREREEADATRDSQLRRVERAVEEYHAQLAAAVEAGTPAPPAPPDANAVQQVHRKAISDIDKAEAAWIREHTDELLATVYERETEIIAAAAELVAKLDELAKEATDLGRAISYVNSRDGIPRAAPSANTDQLIDAVRSSGSKFLLRQPLAGWIFAGQKTPRSA